MNLTAKFDAVIVEPLEEQEEKYGNIIVPDMDKDRNLHGKVVAIGPGKYTVTGTFIDTKTEVGEIVILPTQGFTKLQHMGVEYFIGSETQLLAQVIEEENDK